MGPSDLEENAMSGIKISAGHWIGRPMQEQQQLQKLKKHLKLPPFKAVSQVSASPKDNGNRSVPDGAQDLGEWAVLKDSCTQHTPIKYLGHTTNSRSQYLTHGMFYSLSLHISLHLQMVVG